MITPWWAYLRLFRNLFDPQCEIDPQRIEKLGLLAMKIAQMYAVRADLVGFEKSRRLRTFFENAQPVPRRQIEARFAQAAPPELLAALESWDRTPTATASIAQVHRGTLRDGSEVALKIVKADARARFQSHVRSLRRFLKVLITFYPKLARLADPLGVLEAVERSTLRELDLCTEVEGRDHLRDLRDEGKGKLPHLAQLDFPRIYRELSSSAVLVSEWRPEPSLNDLIAERRFDYQSVLTLFRIHGYFLFLRGSFHGDLHPGNVLYRDGRFVFLDNANVETAPPVLTKGILAMLSALGEDDLSTAADRLASTSTAPLTPANRARLHDGVARLYAEFGGKSVGEASLTLQMIDTVKLAVECGVTFPKQAFPIIKSLMTLDGIVRDVAPQAILLRDTSRFGKDLRLQWGN